MKVTSDELVTVFQNRFTCKRYDSQAHISDEDFKAILEVARLSPSSWGMEPWQLLVVENDTLLKKMLSVARGAHRNADRNVIILARKGVDAHSAYANYIWTEVQGHAPEEVAKLKPSFEQLQTQDLKVAQTPQRLLDWARCQTYIVLADMLYTAALLGIDATPIEGYNEESLSNLLIDEGLLDPKVYAVSVLVQFGKADLTHLSHPKWRRPADEVIKFV